MHLPDKCKSDPVRPKPQIAVAQLSSEKRDQLVLGDAMGRYKSLIHQGIAAYRPRAIAQLFAIRRDMSDSGSVMSPNTAANVFRPRNAPRHG